MPREGLALGLRQQERLCPVLDRTRPASLDKQGQAGWLLANLAHTGPARCQRPNNGQADATASPPLHVQPHGWREEQPAFWNLAVRTQEMQKRHLLPSYKLEVGGWGVRHRAVTFWAAALALCPPGPGF